MSSEEAHNKPQKRADELHDRKLFTQPDETHLGECPICFLPMPLGPLKSWFKPCCSRIVCSGCVYANVESNKHDFKKAGSCPFCREPVSSGGEETHKRNMKRMKANDPAAIAYMGEKCREKGDYKAAFEYWTKAAELGDVGARYNLGVMYENGMSVEKDMEKAVYHYEKAAIGGHPYARHNLACYEGRNGNKGTAVKHFIIAAKLGYEDSMKALWWHYSDGSITKEDLDATLRSHQAALDAMKSEQRKAAERVKLSM